MTGRLKTLYVDIDSTIWFAEAAYEQAEMELHGTTDITSKWFEVHELIERYGKNFVEIFKKALDPALIAQRDMFPGVETALKELSDEGFDIHFLSHSHFPEATYIPMREWLRNSLDFPFMLTLTEERSAKLPTMSYDPHTWGVIEDTPSTLQDAVNAGYETFGKVTTMNQMCDIPGVAWFDDWVEVPSLVRMRTEVAA